MNDDLAHAILAASNAVLPPQRPLPLHEPSITETELRHVADCLRSGWVSTAGPLVDRFEAELRRLTGAGHVIATVNGTAALHAALLAVGVQPGDEVLLPALTFVATANAVSYCGAVPHFVDVSPATLGVDPDALDAYLAEHAVRKNSATFNRSSGRPLRALIVMHTFGHPADMDRLPQLAERWGLALVEDAAESLGSLYRGRHTGTFGRVGILSFNGNKTMTTGGGGAILADDAATAARARHLCTTARLERGCHFVHDDVGFNYRMPSLNAALGLGQLERLPSLLQAKVALARRYQDAFAGVAGAFFFQPASHTRSNHWLNTLILDCDDAQALEAILALLNREGIHARPAWTPMHALPMYQRCPRMPLPETERLARTVVNLPSGPGLIETPAA